MNDCIFCKIVKGEIPSKKVYEDNSVLAFLDINPANPGHVLVIPKKHSDAIFDVSEKELQDMIVVVKKIAEHVRIKMGTDSMNIIQNNGRISGQIVNHIHFHIIPRFENDKVIFSYRRVELSEKDLNEIHEKLREEKKDYGRPW
ncbi:MAG: HIT family protein [Candidatus Aenigmatarchaeota archaeon]